MMTAEEKAAVVHAIGKFYARPIIEHLTKKNMLNSENHSFDPRSIIKIVNGERENPKVELEIVKFAVSQKLLKSRMQIQRKTLLQKR